MSEIVYLDEDVLNGVPRSLIAWKPCVYAQQTLREANLKGEDVISVGEQFEHLLNNWKLAEGQAPRPRGLLDLSPRELCDAEPWECAGWAIQDVYDLFAKLTYEQYAPLHQLQKQYGESELMSVIVLYLALEKMRIEALKDRELAIYKFMGDLVMARAGARVTAMADTFRLVYPKIVEQTEAKAQANFSSKGGMAKNEGARRLKEKAISLFNEGRYRSVRSGANAVAEKVQQYGRDEVGYYLTTDDVVRRIYEWLLRANKEGRLNLPK